MFKVNGEMAPKGANQITSKDGDKLNPTKKSISNNLCRKEFDALRH